MQVVYQLDEYVRERETVVFDLIVMTNDVVKNYNNYHMPSLKR